MAKKNGQIETIGLKPIQIMNNEGQLKGLPKNPRFIRDKDYQDLMKSIKEDPEMTQIREVIVYPFKENYIIIAGNMRFRAMCELKFKSIPCKVLPKEFPVKKLRAIATKDNIHSGKDDWDIIANEWDTEELQEWGKLIPFAEESGNNKSSNIRITITEAGEDEREKIKAILIKAGYKVK